MQIPGMGEPMLMRSQFQRWTTFVLAVVLTAGCGKSPTTDVQVSETDTDFLDDLFSEIDLTDAPLPEPAVPQSEALNSAESVSSVAMSLPEERLELRLNPGDRFRLVKTVEQTLVQT